MSELIDTFVFAYFALAFIKFMLLLPHMPMVMRLLSRLDGAPYGHIKPRYIISIPLVFLVLITVGWAYALYREGLGFFVVYRNYSVIRDVIMARREYDEIFKE